MKKIIITGTKGKTTFTNILKDYYKYLGKSVLAVTNNGIYLNNKEYYLKDIKELFGTIPTKCPGKFLSLGLIYKIDVAVLETTIASFYKGIGVENYDTSILLNVFDDHISTNGKIKNRNELINAKFNICLESLKNNGNFFVFINDKEVNNYYKFFKKEKVNINIIPIFSNLEFYDNNFGYYLDLNEKTI